MNYSKTKLYNLLHSGNEGDTQFYIDACKGADSVLELGCGSGRVTIPLAKQGLNVTGIDIDKSMLDEFKESSEYKKLTDKISLIQHDMRDFKLKKKFDKIIIPFNSILCLLSQKDISSMLTNVKKHLNPNGQLIFDFYYMNKQMVEDTEHKGIWETAVLKDKNQNTIRVTEQGIETNDKQRFDTRYFFVWEDGPKQGQTVEIDVSQRCILIEEIESILKESGFNSCSIKSAFDNQPITDETDQIIACANL